MKRFIIISVMLVLALGLNSQITNTDSRRKSRTTNTSISSEDEKKSSPENTKIRTKDASHVRSSNSDEIRKVNPGKSTITGRQKTPAYNESRNREKPAVKSITSPRKSETPAAENRSSETNSNRVNTPRITDQDQNPNIPNRNQEPERKVSSTPSRERESVFESPENGIRTVGNVREVNVERNTEYVPRTESNYIEKRKTYRTPERPRTVRTVNHSNNYVQHSVAYRKSFYPYSEPRRMEIIWDINMYNEYRYLYPQYDYWYYPLGYKIHTISAYEADYYIGEIARIYGRVVNIWYERQTDEYTLYFGESYPYQDFSVIIPGKYARRYSYRPEHYFKNRNITVTGLVSLWENKPEMLIRKRNQMEIYF